LESPGEIRMPAWQSSADLVRSELDRIQAEGLTSLLADILPQHLFYSRKLEQAGLSRSRLSFPRDLPTLPFTTKAELLAAQADYPPHGELICGPFSRYVRMHQTSGTSGRPLCWYDTFDSWSMLLDCWLEYFRMAGIEQADRLFFAFSFGPFLGFWTAFEAGLRYGCTCLPGGGMSSSARLRFILDNDITVVFCTPTYALRLLEVAAQEGIDLVRSPVRAIVVAGEAGGSIPETRQRIEAGWGARVFDHTGMTETGPLGIECREAPGGLHLLETACWPEVIDPATGQVVSPGTQGELVVTTFRRRASPLIRYRTGDLVRVDPTPCACGRALVRLDGGIRGRIDDMVVIRGNNLHPAALQTILHRFSEVVEYVVEIDEQAALANLCITVELAEGADGRSLAGRVQQAIRNELLFRAEVRAVAPGSLPRSEMKSRRWLRKSAPGAADRAND
jgi:phenylacetate-CoA ligase